MEYESDLKKLLELIDDVKIAMFTTVDDHGQLRSRPLSTMQDGTDSLYFFTRDDTPKVDEVAKESTVCLSYSDPGEQTYVSVSGTARLERDRYEIRRFWNPLHLAWFPKGEDDPDLALIKVTINDAEYWDAPSNSMVTLFGMAKAIVSGQVYAPGDNAKLHLNG